MGTSRLEAFTDGVMAVALTIMVLELDTPETARSLGGRNHVSEAQPF